MRVPTKRRRRLSWYIIWFVIFFFLVGVIFSVVLSLPVWRIKAVSLAGANIISKPYIERMAAPLVGENIFLTDYSKLKEGLKKIHEIKDFGIWRSPPSTVVIKIVERVPFCVIIVSGSSIVVDDEGYFLKVEGGRIKAGDYSFIDIENTSQLPVVRGVDPGRILQNRLDTSLSSAIKVSISRLSKFFPPSNLQFEIKGDDQLNLLVEDILKVYFGGTEEIEKKISVLEAILPVVSGKWGNVDYIDIRVAEDPVIKYRGKP